jgi:hypothetical protein
MASSRLRHRYDGSSFGNCSVENALIGSAAKARVARVENVMPPGGKDSPNRARQGLVDQKTGHRRLNRRRPG